MINILDREGAVKIVADTRTAEGTNAVYGGPYPAAVLYTQQSFVDKNPNTAQALVTALVRGLKWVQTHTPEEIAAKTPNAFRGDDDALYAEALKASMPMFSPDGRMSAEGAEVVRTLLAGSLEKVRSANIDLSKTFTNEFIHGR